MLSQDGRQITTGFSAYLINQAAQRYRTLGGKSFEALPKRLCSDGRRSMKNDRFCIARKLQTLERVAWRHCRNVAVSDTLLRLYSNWLINCIEALAVRARSEPLLNPLPQ
jgi:hypothetical protein